MHDARQRYSTVDFYSISLLSFFADDEIIIVNRFVRMLIVCISLILILIAEYSIFYFGFAKIPNAHCLRVIFRGLYSGEKIQTCRRKRFNEFAKI